jgi:hypothetical protein
VVRLCGSVEPDFSRVAAEDWGILRTIDDTNVHLENVEAAIAIEISQGDIPTESVPQSPLLSEKTLRSQADDRLKLRGRLIGR